MSKDIFKVSMALLATILAMMFTAAPVLAAEFRTGDTITLSGEEVIDDDLYIAGRTIIIDGTVNGDVFAAGNEVIVNGKINGSLMAAGRTVTVNGDVTHAIRMAGETLEIKGNVGGDVLAFGGNVGITSAAKVGGDLILGTGQALIAGAVDGDVTGEVGDLTLSNVVGGDVRLEVDSLTLLSTANIQGNLVYTSQNEAEIQSGAQVGGVTTHKLPPVKEKPAAGMGVWGKVIGFLMTLVLGIIILLLAPRRMKALTESIRTRPWPSLGWGAVILVGTPLAALIVCVTVIGLPLGLIALAVYTIAIYLTQLFIGLLIGELIIGAFRGVETRAALIAALALGLAILSLLKLIPFAGFFIGLVAILFGLGAILVSERKLRAEAQNIS